MTKDMNDDLQFLSDTALEREYTFDPISSGPRLSDLDWNVYPDGCLPSLSLVQYQCWAMQHAISHARNLGKDIHWNFTSEHQMMFFKDWMSRAHHAMKIEANQL